MGTRTDHDLSAGFINYSNQRESNPIRGALAEVILGLISATELNARRVFEQQLEALQVTEEYGIFLTELTLDASGQFALRQMAGVLLKQYVDVHWSIDAEKFKPPEASPQTKATIRAILPHGLKESISKVRSSVAYCISCIAHWDWPDEWPELFNILTTALRGNDAQTPFLVHGAVRVLKEFTRDLTDTQISQVAPIIFPDMYRIFVDQEGRYTIRTRSRAIEIFTTLASMICTIGEVNKSLPKTIMEPILPQFSEALVGGLSLPEGSHLTDAGLKTAILKALTVLVKNVPKIMAPWLTQILPPVWSTLTSSADLYVRDVVNAGDDSADQEEIVDSDGEIVGFENLVFAIFEFVHALVETPKFRPAVRQGLADLMYYIVLYMQITNDQCEKWTDNPDQFVEDEDEDSFTYSVRISSQDLLTALCEEFEEECCVALAQTIQRHLNESNELAASGSGANKEASWKRREAAMLALGTAQEVIERQVAVGNVEFDIKGFLENIVLVDLANPVSPFLLGRCLWIGSKFPKYLSRTTAATSSTSDSSDNLAHTPMGRFVEATVRGLQADQIAVVRIAAVRAIWGFCSHLRNTASKKHLSEETSIERALLNPVLPATIDALINMCTTFSKSTEILGLILENMAVVLSCDPTFTASYESKVSPLAIAIFLKYSTDPVLTSLLQDIFRVIAETPQCLAPLEARLVPTLVSILDAPVSPDSIGSSPSTESADTSFNLKTGVTTGLQAVALDVLQTLVRATVVLPSPASSNGQEGSSQAQQILPQNCLSELVINRAFPAAVRSTLNTDDNAIMQSGGECLRAFVSVAPDQVCSYMDADGKSGLWYMVQVAAQLLNPVGSEFTATFVGRLVTTLIQKTGDRLGSDLDALLKAVLSKLQGSETLSVIQSLLMVYAQLVHSQLEAVLRFLCSVPGPTGENALNFVLTEWVARQHLFYGAYETKVSIVALSKLLQHGVNNNDTRLQEINVKGDLIVAQGATNQARTRSQKKSNPDQWTYVPVLVKIFKLLVQEITSNMDAALDCNSADEDSEEETNTDTNGLESSDTGAVHLSDLLDAATAAKNGTGLGFFDDDGLDEEEDPDALADPLYNINVCRYLTDFVTEFSRQPFFAAHFAPHLNQSEKTTLATIGVL